MSVASESAVPIMLLAQRCTDIEQAMESMSRPVRKQLVPLCAVTVWAVLGKPCSVASHSAVAPWVVQLIVWHSACTQYCTYRCEFGHFRKFVNNYLCRICQSAVSKSNIAKWFCKTSMFLTNKCPADLCALTLCIMLWKKLVFCTAPRNIGEFKWKL